MKLRRVALIATLILACGAARLPAPMGDELRIARALGTPELHAEFKAIRARWQRDFSACRRAAACRARVARHRAEFVAALAARVSDANPTLLDLDAWALTGTWVAGPLVSLDGVDRPYPLEDGIPELGATLAARIGEWCTPSCATVGLEPGRLSDGDGNYVARLSLAAGAQAALILRDGRAGARIVAKPGGAALLLTACKAGMRECAPGWVTLTPRRAADFGPVASTQTRR